MRVLTAEAIDNIPATTVASLLAKTLYFEWINYRAAVKSRGRVAPRRAYVRESAALLKSSLKRGI